MKKIVTLLFLLSSMLWATGITFTFANVTITGTSPSFYEFDVMAQADASGSKLGTNLVYINYNTAGFGSSVAANGKITVTKGTLLEGGAPPSFYYDIVNTTDNTASRFAVTSEYNNPDYPEYGNALPTTPTQLIHIKLEIADINETAGLSFEQPLMVGQEYESDNVAKYSPVTASDTENSSLDPSALEPVSGTGLPEKFALKQNFPTPFNPSTMLQFEIPEITQNLQLTVFDVLGRKVVSLYQGDIQPGVFHYQWNGKDAAGNDMPTGVYFAILKAPQFSQTIKMMLIK